MPRHEPVTSSRGSPIVVSLRLTLHALSARTDKSLSTLDCFREHTAHAKTRKVFDAALVVGLKVFEFSERARNNKESRRESILRLSQQTNHSFDGYQFPQEDESLAQRISASERRLFVKLLSAGSRYQKREREGEIKQARGRK